MKIAIYAGCSENPADNILEVEAMKVTGGDGMLRIWVEGDGPEHIYKRSHIEESEEPLTVYNIPMDEIVNIRVADNAVIPKKSSPTTIEERLSKLSKLGVIADSLRNTLLGIAQQQQQTDWLTFLRANTRRSLLEYEGISNRNISNVELIYKKSGLILV